MADITTVPRPTTDGAADKRAERQSRLRRVASFQSLVAVVAIAVAALVAYPILRVISGLVWVDGTASLDGVRQLADVSGLGRMFLHTAIMVVSVTALAMLVGATLAWLNERTDARLGLVTDVMPLVTFLIPTVALATGWLLLLAPKAGYLNWLIREVLSFIGIHLEEGPLYAYSWSSVIFVYTLSVVPFAFLVVSAGLRQADASQEEQARVCGASILTTLRTVTLPSIRPYLLSASFLCVWWTIAVFSIPVVLARPAGIDVLSVRIVRLLRFDYPPQLGAAITLGMITMTLLGTIWWMQQRVLRNQRFAVVGGKHSSVSRIRLRGWRSVARAAIIGYLVMAVVLPVVAMTLTTLNGFWTLNIDWGGLSLDSMVEVVTGRRTGTALRNSLYLAALAATVTILVTASVAWWASRGRGVVRTTVSAVSKVPAAVSNLVIGIGVVVAFAGYPMYLGGTLLILLLAYVIVSMPEGSILAESAAGNVGRELGEASQVSGARAARTFISVYLPLMLPGLAAGWALVFVRIVGDLAVSVMLAGPSNTVIGFQILDLFENGGYAEMASLALLVTGMSAVVLTAMVYGSSRWSRRGGRG